MRLRTVLLLFTCSFLGGLLVSKVDGETKNDLSAQAEPTVDSPVQEPLVEKTLDASPLPTAVEHAIDSLKLSGIDKTIADSIGSDEFGVKLRRTLIAGNHQDEVSFEAAHALGERYLKEFQQNPIQGLASISQALSALPASQFPIERGSLLIAASTLPGQERVVNDMARREFLEKAVPPRPNPEAAKTPEEQNEAANSSPAMALPIAAHAAFIKTASDALSAMRGTIDGMLVQKDQGIRTTMFAQFLSRFPEKRAEIKTELARLGITGVDEG